MAKAIKKASGEIGCVATVNGKRSALEPIKKYVLPIEVREVESVSTCGFRQNWMSAELKNGDELSLDVGAGLGSRWAVMSFRNKWYVLDGEDIIRAMLTALEIEE